MKASKLIAVILGLCIFSSCVKKGEEIEPNDNKENFEITYLFDVDGIKVYRFLDGGRCIYFTNSEGRIEYTSRSGRQTYKVQTICN